MGEEMILAFICGAFFGAMAIVVFAIVVAGDDE